MASPQPCSQAAGPLPPNIKPLGKTLGKGRALQEPAYGHTHHLLPSLWLLLHPVASSRLQGLLVPVI